MKVLLRNRLYLAAMVACVLFANAYAFEDTRVLPVNVRRLGVRVISAQINESTSATGIRQPLGQRLTADLKVSEVAKGENSAIRRALFTGFLLSEGQSDSLVLGTMAANLQARLTATVPVLAYGIAQNTTAVIAVPIIDIATSLRLGFTPSSAAQNLVNSLASPINNQREAALELADRLNSAPNELNKALVREGYSPLASSTRARGAGDMQMLFRTRLLNDLPLFTKSVRFSGAATYGVVAPTGRIKDANVLLDQGLGDGQWDLVAGFALDQPLLSGNSSVFINEYVRYTHQLPGVKTVRLIENDNPLGAPRQRVHFKLGDKVDTGLSLQAEFGSGLGGGIGYNYAYKMKDFYRGNALVQQLAKGSESAAHEGELELSYSTIPAFLRKELPAPAQFKASYRPQLASSNSPVTNFWQLDVGVFF